MLENTNSSNSYDNLQLHFALLEAIRIFFKKKDFLEVMTPPMVTNPGYEAHIHPYRVYSQHKRQLTNSYLHTSPEFYMKELLSLGFNNIFNICYCFRDEPESPLHRKQFLMLEWYRTNAKYQSIMDDVEHLLAFCANYLDNIDTAKVATKYKAANKAVNEYKRVTVQELFHHYLKIDILAYLDTSSNCRELRQLIEKNYPDIPLPFDPTHPMSWDDYYFLLFLNKIEPRLKEWPYILIYEFPYHLSALSTINANNPLVCERFEVYLGGIELCNCFNELRDLQIQKQRFQEESQIKFANYQYNLPAPSVLFRALERGFPPSAGIAMGVERLLLALTNISNPFYL